MSNTINYRGSEWRKWDLQLHCPDDVLNNNFDGTGSEEKWNNYINKIEETDIEVIAITNYFCIDGYERVLEYKNSGRLNNIHLILPNIEFRIAQPNQKGEQINVHVIFSNDVEIEKINDFLGRLEIINTNEEGKAQYCNQKDLKSVGYKKALIEFSKLHETLESQFEEIRDYMIVGVAQGYGAFRPAINDSRGKSLAIEIDKKSALFFGKEDDVSHFQNTSRYRGAIKKPVISTSDAHDLERIGAKYTFIKANPTFDGLRQVIYEPLERVSHSSDIPLYLYPQILDVKLLNTDSYQDKNNIFTPITLTNKINFSPNFNSIIGPRASGKTVLVELIGYVANIYSKISKGKKQPLINYLYDEFEDLEIEMNIKYGQDEISSIRRAISEKDDPLYNSPIKVEYWIQTEIEKKADNTEEIAGYINDRLQSDEADRLLEDIKNINEEMEIIRENYSKKIRAEIKINKIETEIEQLESYFKKLRTDEYKEITSKLKENRKKRNTVDSLIKDIGSKISVIDKMTRQAAYNNTVDKEQAVKLFEKEETMKEKIERYYDIEEKIMKDIVKELEELLELIKTSSVCKTNDEEYEELANKFSEYCKENGIKISKDEIDNKNNRIEYLNQQLAETKNEVKKYNSEKEQHDQLSKELNDCIKEWREKNENVIKEFNNKLDSSKIEAIWADPKEYLEEWLKEQFSQANKNIKGVLEESYNFKSPVRENHLEDIIIEIIDIYGDSVMDEIEAILKREKEIDLVESAGKKDTLMWYFSDDRTEPIREDLLMRINGYSETGDVLIKYGDKILGVDNMSFGEKCGTLIELIMLSGEHPLIIDQPEDHLDSIFVAEKLVELIREQKLNRQIIICTHNANIVVLGDSELITSLEINSENKVIVNQGALEEKEIRSIICDTLEGGVSAFRKREQKYS